MACQKLREKSLSQIARSVFGVMAPLNEAEYRGPVRLA
jgi:hypothetical protein